MTEHEAIEILKKLKLDIECCCCEDCQISKTDIESLSNVICYLESCTEGVCIDMKLPNSCLECPLSKVEEISVEVLGFDIYRKYFLCKLTGETFWLDNGTKERMPSCPIITKKSQNSK